MNKSTILGYLIVFFVAVLCYLDMYLSTKVGYTFKLEFWQVMSGLGVGVGLVALPEKEIIYAFRTLIDKYFKRK